MRRFIPTPVGNTTDKRDDANRDAVHPHARGEHRADRAAAAPDDGSSPRPWGTPNPVRRTGRPGRFIPTPVGNTSVSQSAHLPWPVHPHARGEHERAVIFGFLCGGSSPRPWGTLEFHRAPGDLVRFIPTPVGNTLQPATSRSASAVHPHARGEHAGNNSAASSVDGSSPRPWGTLQVMHQVLNRARFIPTPVGNTPSSGCAGHPDTVHPHARGEHDVEVVEDHLMCGSSPRPWGTHLGRASTVRMMRFIPTPVGNTLAEVSRRPVATGSSPRPWGTPVPAGEQDSVIRFIPTPVGNTWWHPPPRCPTPVHPHARGEHISNPMSSSMTCGSSPRPWGTHDTGSRNFSNGRFIPTPVGNTSADRTLGTITTVHPHARGEHRVHDAGRFPLRGSSPRPWGTRLLGHRQQRPERFIPTPVGNTNSTTPGRV